MKLKSLQLLCCDSGLTSTALQPIRTNQFNRSIFVSLLTLAVAVTAQPDKAAAIDLVFGTPDEVTNIPNVLNALGPGYSGNIISYKNVAPGVDARITATTFGANYSFVANIPNYSAANPAPQPAGDAAFVYQIAGNQVGKGGLDYRIDLYQSGTNYTTAYVAPDLRFLVYDVDGEASQGEAVRVSKDSGLIGYQVGSTAQALIPTEDATSYLFSGRDVNVAETDPSGSTILYFQNTSSVTFQFEANTRTSTSAANPVFSAIDGDLSLIGQNTSAGFNTYVSTVAAATPATAVPEPFTIIGTLVGGSAAMRMRKKLKSSTKA